MRTLTTAFLASSLLVASLFACGGGENPPPNTPPGPPASATPAPPASSVAVVPPPSASSAPPAASSAPPVAEAPKFDSLPRDKKVEIMSTKVVPTIGKDLKDFDAKRFATVNCATCHGPSKKEDPHKVLPKLTLSGGGYEKMKAKHPEIVKVMEEKVLPDMAAALGDKNLKCGGCHEVK